MAVTKIDNTIKMLLGAGTSALAFGIGVIAVAGPATGAAPSPPEVAALSSGSPNALPASASAVLKSAAIAEEGPDTDAARRVAAPGSDGNSWYLVPTARGACIVTGESGVTCTPTSNVNAGKLVSMTLPAPTSGDKDALSTVGGGAIFEGVAPDGVDAVRAIGTDGRVLATTLVVSNVYRLSIPSVKDATALQLVRGSGAITDVDLAG